MAKEEAYPNIGRLTERNHSLPQMSSDIYPRPGVGKLSSVKVIFWTLWAMWSWSQLLELPL